jgi:hypothetical protein
MEDSEDVLEEMIAELDQQVSHPRARAQPPNLTRSHPPTRRHGPQVIKLCFDDPRTTAGGGVDSIPAVKAKRDECRERLYQLQENRREAEAAEARRREQERMAATNRPATAPPQKAREPVSKVTVDMMR